MSTGFICLVAYMIVGIFLANYWFKKEFQEDYNTLSQNGEVETGMTSLLLLIMAFFWPLKLAYNLIRYRKL